VSPESIEELRESRYGVQKEEKSERKRKNKEEKGKKKGRRVK